MSFALIFWYGCLLWDWPEKRPHFDHAGDNLYYVGFLYTLISLADSLRRFTAQGYTEDIVTGFVSGFSLALSSTFFGLVARVIVNQPADDEPAGIEARSRADLARGHRELRAQMDYAIEDYQRFREDLTELRTSVEDAKAAGARQGQILEAETARLDDLHGLGSRLEIAAEDAVRKMAEQQEELVRGLKHASAAAIQEVGVNQEQWAARMAEEQGRISREVAARHEEMASRLGESVASMVRAIGVRREAFEGDAQTVRRTIEQSLKSLRSVDFQREIADRVLDPAGAQLRELIEGFEPLVVGLQSARADQQRATESNREILQHLARVFSQNQDLASGYQVAADSLAKAADALSSLPKQFERQSGRTEAALAEVDTVGERLRAISGALDSATASVAVVASQLESRRGRGLFARLLGRS